MLDHREPMPSIQVVIGAFGLGSAWSGSLVSSPAYDWSFRARDVWSGSLRPPQFTMNLSRLRCLVWEPTPSPSDLDPLGSAILSLGTYAFPNLELDPCGSTVHSLGAYDLPSPELELSRSTMHFLGAYALLNSQLELPGLTVFGGVKLLTWAIHLIWLFHG